MELRMTRQQKVVKDAYEAEIRFGEFGIFRRISRRLRMTPSAAKMRYHRFKLANGHLPEQRPVGPPCHIAQLSVCGEI